MRKHADKSMERQTEKDIEKQTKIRRSRRRNTVYEEIVTIENKKRQTFIPMDTESASIL
jgi:hypothetical protein